ncbi:MAG: LamG-like jellyroll fold domain-containing protein [Planctomycetota bacterium]|jgi:hypothetical protein
MCRKLGYLFSFVLVLSLLLTSVADAFSLNDPALIAYWSFDEGSGLVATDLSQNSYNGTLQGGVTWTDGKYGSALQFNGSDAYVSTGQAFLNGLSGFTLAGWISASNVGSYSSLFGQNDLIEFGFVENSQVGTWMLGNDWQLITADYTFGYPSWHHVVLAGDATRVVIYIDGQEAASDEGGMVSGSSGFTFNIGANVFNASGDPFLGEIDDVWVFSRALSQEEIQDLMLGAEGYPYASGPDPADDALLTDFPFGSLGKTLTWKAGDFAETHNVYFGEDFNDVNDGTGDTFQGNQSGTYFLVGYGHTPEDPLPGGLEPGMTYYWRIDEVNDTEPNSPWKGKVWSFSLPPTKAYEPTPINGSTFVDANVNLTWGRGLGAAVQTVYFGTDYDTVNNRTTDGMLVGEFTTYDPGSLEYNTHYYWCVDTAGTYGNLKGDVWSFTTTIPGLGTIVSERWDDIAGDDLNTLKSYYKYPNDPDVNEVLTQLSSDLDLDNYGGRIHGWLYPPETGDYTFWLCSDNQGELWLSNNDDSSNMVLIAQESTWQNLNVWGTGEEQSDLITLQAGERYYIMALWKSGTGGDHCQVAWQGPDIEDPTIIPGTYLSPYKPLKAYGSNPVNRATGVTQKPVLEWKPGIQAASHEVYFGTDEDAVMNATKTSPEYIGPRTLGNESYDPGILPWESTYYWRVDEVNNTNPDSPWVGSVWSFTTADYAIVDDFEDYNATNKQIWAIWHDGFGYWDFLGVFHPGNGTGSGVGDEDNDDTYMEETVVHEGAMSMPYFFNNNEPTKAKYSEAKMTLSDQRDWTEEGVKALSLWFQGIRASTGSFTDNLDGTYTITASGTDITGPSDEFHFAYKSLTGAGSIIARVDSMDNTDPWAKAGVMIRESLDPNSAHAMAFVTPENGVVFEYRPDTGADNVGAAGQQTGITAPHWVKLDRDIVGNITASQSADGLTWDILGTEQNIPMNIPMYIGLAVTAHNASATCQAEFSNVQVSVSGPWLNQDIGILSNDPEPMYVAVSNSNGTTGTVYYEDNDNIVTDATQIDTWTEFNIDLKDFQNQGVNLADVNSVTIGFGTRGSTTPGGAGKVYIDDIRLYRPRCVPDKVTLSEADYCRKPILTATA